MTFRFSLPIREGMASRDSSKSPDSPSNHPMVLRSSCRLCCAAESPLSSDFVVDHAVHRRNVHRSRVKGDIHHHHHHLHPHQTHENFSAREEYVVQNADYAGTGSKTLTNKSSTEVQKQKVTTSQKNITFALANSLHKSSLVEQLTSLNVAAVAKKLIRSSSVNFLSTSMNKEVYSDYSSGDESTEFFYRDDINKSDFHVEDMSKLRAQKRIPLSSMRFFSESEDTEDRVNLKQVLQGRNDENSRTLSSHLVDSSVDNIGLSRVLRYSNSGGKTHKSALSRNNHLYSAEGSFNETLHSGEIHVEGSHLSSASSQPQPFPYSDSVFAMMRWLFWRCIYHNICEVLLLDTWILSRCHTLGKKKIILALLLLLIPLWLLGLFFHEKYSGDLHNSNGVLKSGQSWGSLFSYSFLSAWFSRKQQESSSLPVCSNDPETSHSMWSGVWNFFSVEEENSGMSDFSSSDKLDADVLMSNEMSDEKIKTLALEVFKKESYQLMKELEKKRSNQGQAEQENMKMVLSEISSVASQYQYLSDSLQTLKGEIKEQMKSDTAENIQSHPQLLLLNSKLQDLQEKLTSFETLLASAKNCCENQSDILLAESHLNSLLMKMMDGNEDENHPVFAAFRSWLRSNFISRKNLSDEIASMVENMYGSSLQLPPEHYENIAKRVAESVISKSMKTLKHDIINLTKASSSASAVHYAQGAFSVDDVQKIVKEAILLYDADKTGLVDYALESGGGSIISTRCSETYYAGTARLSIFGLPLWYTSKSPRTAIQPEVQPGECWAFQGSRGFLVIQLSATIKPLGFSMEHIPKSLAPTGTIDSAPKEFSVWGLTLEEKDEGKLLGKFIYDSDGDPLQYFPVQTENEDYFSVVELKILSNWGNQKYTCLYRFRVHGIPL